jgi:hypothetical protein
MLHCAANRIGSGPFNKQDERHALNVLLGNVDYTIIQTEYNDIDRLKKELIDNHCEDFGGGHRSLEIVENAT